MDQETKQQLLRLLCTGRFFAVEFTKRSNGARRRMLARTGVHAGLSSGGRGGRAYDPAAYDLLCVYDVHKRAWRNIPLDSLHWVRANGQELRLENSGE